MFAAGKDVSVNLILGLTFIKATRSIIDLGNGVVESKLDNIEPWRITFKRALLSIPKVAIAEISIHRENYSTFFTDLAAIKTVIMTDFLLLMCQQMTLHQRNKNLTRIPSLLSISQNLIWLSQIQLQQQRFHSLATFAMTTSAWSFRTCPTIRSKLPP
mmetsp:Transcript_25133/g.52560  ORF Transcript_25133/g.52560 Transcript_25133/m.52560 type:complete len:158 (+) Transcript_25133:1341-1814(+)